MSKIEFEVQAYQRAQLALAELKGLVLSFVASRDGCSNAQVGRALGIYQGHAGHEGHISRTLLGMLEADGVVEQRSDKRWHVRGQ